MNTILLKKPVRTFLLVQSGPSGKPGKNANPIFTIPAQFDGQSMGDSAVCGLDFPMTLLAWKILTPFPCDVQFDVLKSTEATYPNFASIVGSSPPVLTSDVMSTDTDLSDWDVDFVEGDVLQITLIDATNSPEWIVLNLKATRNVEV